MKKVLFVILLSLVLFSCSNSSGVAKVGDMVITQDDIKETQLVNTEVGGDSISDVDAALITIQRFMDVLIAKEMGIDLSDSVLSAESLLVDSLMDSVTVNKIKEVLKDNPEGYRRVFLRPFVARQKIEEKFYYDSLGYQKTAWDSVQTLKKELIEGKRNVDDVVDGFYPFSVTEKDTTNPLMYMFIDNYFKSLPKGTKIAVLQDNTAYVIAKKIRKGVYKGFVYPKHRLDKFYIDTIKKLGGIKINDSSLKEKIKEQLKGSPWEELII